MRYQCYLITNTKNDKKYIGITETTVALRWSRHRHDMRKGTVTPLYAAMRKHGAEAFTIEVIGGADSVEAIDELEKKMIVAHNSHYTLGGYNVSWGGFFKGKHDEETRRKLSLSNQHCRPVEIDGVHYPSAGYAASELDIPYRTIVHRLGSPYCLNYQRLECEKKAPVKPRKKNLPTGERHHNARKVEVTGVTYPTITAAARALGVNNSIVRNRALSPHFDDYQFV